MLIATLCSDIGQTGFPETQLAGGSQQSEQPQIALDTQPALTKKLPLKVKLRPVRDFALALNAKVILVWFRALHR